jgi:hypothetical protein
MVPRRNAVKLSNITALKSICKLHDGTTSAEPSAIHDIAWTHSSGCPATPLLIYRSKLTLSQSSWATKFEVDPSSELCTKSNGSAWPVL